MSVRTLTVVVVLVICAGCVMPSHQQIQLAMNHTNRVWKAENQQFIREHGSRYFSVPTKTAFTAVLSTLNSLGFSIEDENRENGTIYAIAQAPSPLTDEEWSKAKTLDEPQFQEICSKYVGHWASRAKLHTDGVEIHVIVAVLKKDTGSVVGFQFTMVDHKLSGMGYTPVKSTPPNVTKLALYKAWLYLEKIIETLPKKPKPSA